MATDEPLPVGRGHPTEIRISRGATAMGTDGALGVVQQIIMDQRTGELQALVLATDGPRRLELPASHVLHATGDAVYVDVGKADLLQHPELAPPYDPARYIPVSPVSAHPASEAPAAEHPVVTNVERDAIGVVVPQPSGPFPPPPIPAQETETPATESEAEESLEESLTSGSLAEDKDTAPVVAVPVTTLDEIGESGAAGDEDRSTVASVGEQEPSGLDIAASSPEIERTESVESAVEDEEEATIMERSNPAVNPANPGATSGGIHEDETRIADMLDESEHGYTHPAPPEIGQRSWQRQGLAESGDDGRSQLSWVPAVALGALIVGIGAWMTMRTIRRGRRKAAKAARKARANLRDSMRDAGKSAVNFAQTMRASAQEMAANPRDTANDAFSNFADIPARYRWFRRGMRVGAQVGRFQRS